MDMWRGGRFSRPAVASTFARGTGARRTSMAGAAPDGTLTATASRNITAGASSVETTTASARAVTLTRLVAPASRALRSRLGSSRRPTRTRKADAVVVAVGTPAAKTTPPAFGLDAAADDPESPLLVSADGYRAAGRLLGELGLPSVAVQEGGYHLPSLGELVCAYLDGHAGGGA